MSSENDEFYKPGDLIYASEPFAHVVYHERNKEFCDYCLTRNSKVKACAVCRYVGYCNRTCQKSAWPDHKAECKKLENLHEHNRDFNRLVGKVLLKLKAKGQDYYETVGTYKRNFKDLISHVDELSKLPDRHIALIFGAQAILRYLGMDPSNDESLEDTMEAVGKVRYNRFAIWSSCLGAFGSGLYLGASIFDHSCIPNALRVFNGKTIEIRAIKPIPKGDIKNVTIAYFPTLSNGIDRKENMAEFFAKCYCIDCSSPYGESVLTKIIDKDKAGPVIVLSERVLERLESFEEGIQADTAVIEGCLKMQEGVLGDTNILRLRMLDRRCFLDFDYEARKKYGKELLKNVKLAFGDASDEVNVVYEMLADACRKTGDFQEARKYMGELIELMKIQGRRIN